MGAIINLESARLTQTAKALRKEAERLWDDAYRLYRKGDEDGCFDMLDEVDKREKEATAIDGREWSVGDD